MNILRSLLCAFGLLLLAARADALTMYASTAAGAAGELYTLDSSTGAVIQDIGSLNDINNVNYPITGLAFQPHSGALLGSTGNNPAATAAMLVKINPATAQVIVIGAFNVGNTGNPATMSDLAFDSAGILYGIGSVGGPNLYTINTSTGQATLVGSTDLLSTSGGGLAISSAGVFYGTPTSTRYGTYNSTTGAYTNITAPSLPAGLGAYTALDFDGSVLYGLNTGPTPVGGTPPTHIVTIAPATGVVTDIGASLDSLDAIAFQPAPALPGDYNNNSTVDAADYPLWRKNNGTSNSLGPNDPLGVPITLAQYTQWRANFGKPPGSGVSVSSVPEPACTPLILVGILAMCPYQRVTAGCRRGQKHA